MKRTLSFKSFTKLVFGKKKQVVVFVLSKMCKEKATPMSGKNKILNILIVYKF